MRNINTYRYGLAGRVTEHRFFNIQIRVWRETQAMKAIKQVLILRYHHYNFQCRIALVICYEFMALQILLHTLQVSNTAFRLCRAA